MVAVKNPEKYQIGDLFYAVPMHICPTVAKYPQVLVVENGIVSTSWKVAARDHKIINLMQENFIFDAHLDLSMNAMEWNRDLRLSVAEIREREKGMNDKPDRAKNTRFPLPAMREGNIGLCVATQIARYT